MTTHFVVGCPDASEHSPYFGRYISLVSDPDILTVLESQWKETAALLRGLNEKDGPHRYAPDKWTVREVLGHMNDTERIFAYRALRIARADKTPLAGFEQDDYVLAGGFEKRTLADLREEFDAIRKSSLFLFRGLEETAWTRQGTANKEGLSVRSLAYMIAGHELHHRRILLEKYFPSHKLSA
ncbi:MAG TPA: DinB family protein [Terriglobales bacterium]|jgi:hypothetical protein